ncbi:helix-turn-helix domain-containing protein [Staphylococcus aureus]
MFSNHETKKLTKASELLNYSQYLTVSTHIEKLERQLDVNLFIEKNMV